MITFIIFVLGLSMLAGAIDEHFKGSKYGLGAFAAGVALYAVIIPLPNL